MSQTATPAPAAHAARAEDNHANHSSSVEPRRDPGAPGPASPPAPNLETRLNNLASLLERLEPKASSDPAVQAQAQVEYENHLAQVRLGMANSLFTALRCKHAATASHSVRVALGCSAWGLAMQLSQDQRDALEVAALLHDIGKIGVPDRILLKPSALASDEQAQMEHHRALGLSILESCCASAAVLDIVRHAPAWFDGSRASIDRQGANLPLGSRMLSIVDAFDSMTTAQVYRPAMSRERAIKELCDFAGTQFDPQLVLHFAGLHATDQQKLHRNVARRWLQDIDPETANAWWQLQTPNTTSTPAGPADSAELLFPQSLLANMYDGVIFLDADLHVVLWNRGAERLTGINGASMLQCPFNPALIDLRDEHGRPLADEQCPVSFAVKSGVQSLRRLVMRDRHGRDLTIDIHSIPVVGPDGSTHGASLLLHDASGQASLEERCHSLYEQATRDPLTQLANRAEFDRVHAMFVAVHVERQLPCSLIICDLDHFKHINDTFGHPAGDEVIKSFSQILKSACRPGDLVARYGGEEFVVLCADCDNATANARAEQLRRAFADLPQPAIGGKNCTASFGVTEIQAGDVAQTMLNRSDRALLQAKQNGRNMVVQLGSGMSDESHAPRRPWRFWQSSAPAGALFERHLITKMPLDITVEKLRGFVCDHKGIIDKIDGDKIDISITTGKPGLLRRAADRAVPMLIHLDFRQEQVEIQSFNSAAGVVNQTKVHVLIRPKRARDRRRSHAQEQARLITASLRSYLMASEADTPNDSAQKKVNAVVSALRS